MRSIPKATGTSQLQISLMTTYNLRYDEVRKRVDEVRSELAMSKWDDVTPELWRACHELISGNQKIETETILEDTQPEENSPVRREQCAFGIILNETLDATEEFCLVEEHEDTSSSSTQISILDQLQLESGEELEMTDATTVTDEELASSHHTSSGEEGYFTEVAQRRVSSEPIKASKEMMGDQNESVAEVAEVVSHQSSDCGIEEKSPEKAEPPKVIYLLHAYLEQKEEEEKLEMRLSEGRREHNEVSRSPIRIFSDLLSKVVLHHAVDHIDKNLATPRKQNLSSQESKPDPELPVTRKKSGGKCRPRNVVTQSELVKRRSKDKNSRNLFIRSRSEKTLTKSKMEKEPFQDHDTRLREE